MPVEAPIETEFRIASAATVVAPTPKVRTRNRVRSARKSLVAGMLVFLAVTVACHRGIDDGTIPVRDPIYREKSELLRTHPEFFAVDSAKTRLLGIGSSRMQLAFDASQLNDSNRIAFNFGAAGCGPVTQALMLRRLLAGGMHCEEALLEIHPAMLADHNPPFEHIWLHSYRLDRGEPETLRSFGWAIETPEQFRTTGPFTALSTYRFSLLNAFAPAALPCPFGLGFAAKSDPFGHVPGIEIDERDRRKFLLGAYKEYAAAFDDYRIGGPAVAAMRDMLIRLKAHGIRPILYLSPESSEFRASFGTGSAERIRRFSQDLGEEFEVPFLDAREWIPDAGFVDGHHATPKGAKAFTERLKANGLGGER